jgi:hypothetical protein
MRRHKVLAFLGKTAGIALTVGLAFGAIWQVGDHGQGVAMSVDAGSASNMLANGSFEVDSWTRDTLYWTPDGGPYSNPFGEIFTPASWTTWWREGFPCATGYTFDEGRPEVHVIDLDDGFPDAARVRSGTRAAKQFTYWRCHEMGLLQQVDVVPGAHYDLTAYGHAWHTTCSSKPHSPPLDNDCETPLPDSWDQLQVGIDPTGGLDPHGSTVVWSTPVQQYGVYGQSIELVGVQASAAQITVFLRSECNFPLRHNDAYWDDVELQRVERLYFPVVRVGPGGG